MQRPSVDLARPAVRLLRERFEALRALRLPSDAAAETVLRAFYSIIPLINAESRGVALRNALVEVRESTSSAEMREAATRAIAVSDLADGLPDRAAILRDDLEWSERWRDEAAAFETAYGAAIITRDWSRASRGASILWYLQEHLHFTADRDVLHVAPEVELQAFVKQAARSYVTIDATDGEGITHVADLCATGLPSESFEVAICHRVLEHVLDDSSAIRELHRLLRPGALLQVSVPQAVHRSRTVEWLLPDRSHHGHVRHYGADFVHKLERAGFDVELEDWLLRQPEAKLRERGAYPMRFYWARKAP